MKYVFERGQYPNETVIAEKDFDNKVDAVIFAKQIDADYVWDCPPDQNPSSVYRKSKREPDPRFGDTPTGERDLYWCWHQNEPVIIEYRGKVSHCIACESVLLDDVDEHTFIAHVKKPHHD